MRRFLLPAFLSVLMLAPAVHAEEMPKPDDRVVFDLAAEDWVTTKTARVTVNVEAAVSGANAGSARADMMKAVNGLAAGDWRLIGFNRSQDQTGLERWSASFEARLPEASLGGLNDSAKKLSKAGMQVSVGEIDFSPTLDETEVVRAALRAQLYKKAADQLAALNGVLSGRGYRVASIDFSGGPVAMPMPGMMAGSGGGRAMPMVAMAAPSAPPESPEAERSEKVTLTARVVFAALPPVPDAKH
jgi:hypothetical protein